MDAEKVEEEEAPPPPPPEEEPVVEEEQVSWGLVPLRWLEKVKLSSIGQFSTWLEDSLVLPGAAAIDYDIKAAWRQVEKRQYRMSMLCWCLQAIPVGRKKFINRYISKKWWILSVKLRLSITNLNLWLTISHILGQIGHKARDQPYIWSIYLFKIKNLFDCSIEPKPLRRMRWPCKGQPSNRDSFHWLNIWS